MLGLHLDERHILGEGFVQAPRRGPEAWVVHIAATTSIQRRFSSVTTRPAPGIRFEICRRILQLRPGSVG
jgi:hypothetical protein